MEKISDLMDNYVYYFELWLRSAFYIEVLYLCEFMCVIRANENK